MAHETTDFREDSIVALGQNDVHQFEMPATAISEATINYIGLTLPPVTDQYANILFTELNKDIIEGFFCDGDGKHSTSEGIKFRLAMQGMQLYVSTGQQAPQSEYSTTLSYSLNCLKRKVVDKNTIEVLETHLPRLTLMSAEISGNVVSVSVSEGMSAVDAETESLVNHLVGVMNSNQASIIGGTKTAVSYVYLRQTSPDEHEYERFVFFSFLRDNGTDILVQWATPYTLIENDEIAQQQKDARSCFCDFLKDLVNASAAEHRYFWDFHPVYAEVGHGLGFPRTVDGEELITLWDFFQKVDSNSVVIKNLGEPTYRILFYGPYNTSQRGSEHILEWYILDDTCSWVRKKGEKELYVIPSIDAVDYVRFLCENTHVIKHSANDLSSAFETLESYCLEKEIDLKQLWYNPELSSPYILWRVSRAQYEEGITIAEENYLQLFCESKGLGSTAYEVLSFDLIRKSADSSWTVYPQGIAGSFLELHSESSIDYEN